MRLFIAIQFEEKILDAITDFQDDLKAQGVTGNYTLRENLHLTLAFIGEYGNSDDILDAMEQVELSPVEIRLEGVGRFGNLFWVGLSENPELAGYVKRLRRKLSEYGIPYDKKRFTPHITVIRSVKASPTPRNIRFRKKNSFLAGSRFSPFIIHEMAIEKRMRKVDRRTSFTSKKNASTMTNRGA